MSKKKNLNPKDVDEELGKGQSPRDVNPMPHGLRKRNRGEERAQKELEEKDRREYPGMKE